jgi:uncharacterized membrane protein YfhO
VDAPTNSLVVIRNSFGTGWTATVDGRASRVVSADYLLQAVPVPAGAHDIVVAYRDPAIGEGLAASGIVWAGWAAGLLVAVVLGRSRRRRRDRTTDEPADVVATVTPPAHQPVPATTPQ